MSLAGLSRARRMVRWLVGIGLVCAMTSVATLMVEVWFPFRPTPQAVAAYMARPVQWDPRVGIPAPGPEHVRLLQPLDHWQIALTTNEQADGRPCFWIRYVTARWLSGPGTQISGGRCFTPEYADSSVQLHSLHMYGYVAGGISTDPTIVRLRATWLDGTSSSVAVENRAFLVVRGDGVGLLSVVGLDRTGKRVDRSQTYDENMDFRLDNAYAVREVVSAHGLIWLSAYTRTVPTVQECIRLGYGTTENVGRAMTGQTYLAEQMLCTDPTNQTVGPAASAAFDSVTFAGGRVFDPAVTAVIVQWSDGQHQTAPVVEGFYFVERPSTAVSVTTVSGLGQP
jgi:hypothetical protein